MKITKLSTPNQTKGRNGQVPIMIVCHRTCGKYEGAVSWLSKAQSGASSHFVVAKDGRITQLVDIQNTAWCNGTSMEISSPKYYKNSTLKSVRESRENANNYTVSIEFEGMADENGELTVIQKSAGVELVLYIISEVKRIYGYEIKVSNDTIVGHCHITPKWKPNCPGVNFPYDSIIEDVNSIVKAELSKEGYMIEKREFLVNGDVKKLNSILFEKKNYVELRELEVLGLKIGYDKDKKLAVINS